MKKRKALIRKRLLLAGAAVITGVVIITLAAFSIRGTDEIPEDNTPKTSASSSSLPEPLPITSGSAPISVSVLTEVTPEPEKLESLGEFVITAYCPCVLCCGEWSAEHPSRVGTDYIQKTASGTIPTAGRTIGVDPSVIPFGTVVIGHCTVDEDSQDKITQIPGRKEMEFSDKIRGGKGPANMEELFESIMSGGGDTREP